MITFEEAIAKDQAKYLTVSEAGITPADMVSACVDCMVVTNPTSFRPVACTQEPLDGCMGFAIENVGARTLAVSHIPLYRKEALKEMIASVRRTPTDKLRIHMIGTLYGQLKGQPLRSYEDWKREMCELIEIVNGTDNAELCTFDVGSKPHPIAFGIGYVNGKARLIRGTDDVRSYDECDAVANVDTYYSNHPFAGALQFDPTKELTPPFLAHEDHPQYLAWDGRLLPNQDPEKINTKAQRANERDGRQYITPY